LAREVYAPGLRGSLQPELLGATRRHGFIPYVLRPDADALAAELAARRPVLVLQNLGVKRVPVWHYAVVVGLDGDDVILRSGTEQRRIERRGAFLRSWQRGASWAFVALTPGEIPATATADAYIGALADAERLLGAAALRAYRPTLERVRWLGAAALRAYRAALERWPDDELVLFAAAGERHATGDLVGATALYRQLLAASPDQAAARNNLANVLAERGCHTEALAQAHAAREALAPSDALASAVRDTVAELERAEAEARAPAARCE
jgi:hypothetical protein